MRTYFITILIVLSIILMACTTADEATPQPTEQPETNEATETIILGDIDQDDPIVKVREFQPIADYLAANLTDYNFGQGSVAIAPDLATMISLVENSEVDIYYDSLYPAMLIAEATGARPLLRGWRGGEPVYHSVFFAMADSGITSLDDLVGKKVAYDDPASTSGYMIPTSYLISNGLNPVELSTSDANVPEDSVGYVFSNDDENTIEWVISGIVDAGVVDNLTFLDDVPEETRESMIIIAETDDVPRRVLMIRSGIDEDLASEISTIFMGFDETDEGLELLDIVRTAQFDEFPGGVDEVFDPIREMLDIIEEHEAE